MTRTDHPLTEARAAELWDASRDPRRPLADRHEELHHDERATAVAAMRAAFDAGREHERAQARPAEEITLPTEHPAHLTDVKALGGGMCAYMALDHCGYWCGVDLDGHAREWPTRWLATFTLPDGTRARRDGEHEDGTTRFVKEDA